MLKAAVRKNGDVTIVDLSGDITFGEGSRLLRQTIRDLASAGSQKILLNLAEVGFVDSGGLGEMVTCYASVSRQGGRMKLVNIQRRVSELLELTKVSAILEVYQNEPLAVLSME